MKPAVVLGLALLALAVLVLPAPSQGGSSYENVVKELIATLNMLTDVLGTVKDEPTARAAVPEVKKVMGRFDEINKKAKALPQPEKEEKDRITKLYRPKLQEAVRKEKAEAARVKSIPGGKELVELTKPSEGKTK
ncbi:MAG TPA: hypothetical protein VGX70_14315 [Gemmataceae bacterium]|jgi:hypothetical protein|nr:hypothetical protein [Gemmataceae bacterium]